jgi:apolipoprotein N-acyltransferase
MTVGAGVAAEPVSIGKIARRLWPWLAAVSSGLLYAACFEPFNQSWLCWICLSPLLGAVWFSGKRGRLQWLRNLALGYVAGLVFFWAVFSWLTTVTIPGWFLLQFYMAIYFALWAWFCAVVRPRAEATVAIEAEAENKWSGMLRSARNEPAKKPVSSPWLSSWRNLLLALVIASAWVTTEWLRGWVLSGFGWNGLGVALHANWIIIQVAEFTGVLGLSFVVAFANVIAVTTSRRLILEARTRAMRPHWDLNFTMLGIVGLILFGWHAAKTPRPSHPVRVAAVQADIPRAEKFDRQFSAQIFDQFRRLSQLALETNPRPDLLVWPESSMPGPVLEDEPSYQFVTGFSAQTKVDILLGTIEVVPGHDYNAALLVTDSGQDIQLYRKLHLVPFGEYIPGRHTLPLLAQIIGDQVPGDFDVGTDYTIFRLTTPDVRVAPLICFEDTIGELTRHFVLPVNGQPGANLLVNVTNDGWFLHSAGSRQHLAHAIFRCVETRRPMVRAANTGVTCFVNELGRVTQILKDEHGDTFGEGVLCDEVQVPSGNELTFYVKHGDLAGPLSAAIAGLTIAVVFGLKVVRRAQLKERRSSTAA